MVAVKKFVCLLCNGCEGDSPGLPLTAGPAFSNHCLHNLVALEALHYGFDYTQPGQAIFLVQKCLYSFFRMYFVIRMSAGMVSVSGSRDGLGHAVMRHDAERMAVWSSDDVTIIVE